MTTTDLFEELRAALDGERLDDYRFALEEREKRWIATMTNGAVRRAIVLEGGETELLIRYSLVQEKGTGDTAVYAVRLERGDGGTAIVTRDAATGEAVREQRLDDPTPLFGTGIDDCIAKWDASCDKTEAQQRADETCEVQLVHFSCCDNDGCIFLVMIVEPQTIRCSLAEEFDGGGEFALPIA